MNVFFWHVTVCGAAYGLLGMPEVTSVFICVSSVSICGLYSIFVFSVLL